MIAASTPVDLANYLQHWWIGDAARFYDARWVTLDQANKLAKVGQLLAGLLALFELLSFSALMSKLRGVAVFTARVYFFWHFLLSVPRFLLTLILTTWLVIAGMLAWPGFQYVLQNHVDDAAQNASERANRFLFVRWLSWLQMHPVPELYIKGASFIAFVVLSVVEIATDV